MIFFFRFFLNKHNNKLLIIEEMRFACISVYIIFIFGFGNGMQLSLTLLLTAEEQKTAQRYWEWAIRQTDQRNKLLLS